MAWWHMGSVLYIRRGRYLVSLTWGSNAEGTPQSCSAYVRFVLLYISFLEENYYNCKQISENLGATRGV